MKRWWNRQERLEWELQALDARGFDYEIIGGGPSEPGELHIRVAIEFSGQRFPLDVFFPELYPYFRFQVALREGPVLDHHHNPFAGYLCVLDRPTSEWQRDDTLVEFLEKRVPRAIEAGQADADELEVDEVQQAEPFSNYYPYQPKYIALIDGGWELDDEADRGLLELGYFSDPPEPPLRLVVREVQDDSGNTLAKLPDAVDRHCAGTRYARWLKLDQPIEEGDPARFFEVATEHDQQVRSQDWQEMNGGRFKAVATVFPEEQEWRDSGEGTGWVFAVRENSSPPDPTTDVHFVRAGRIGRNDLIERIPELSHMSDHTIAVAGLGGLGAPVAIELARMGVEKLNLIDHDFVDPATTVRWPLGLKEAGQLKTHALAEFIDENFPYTRCRCGPIKIGNVRQDERPREWEALESLLDEATLILDATAEHGVQRFLSDYARRAGAPYVWVEGRQGGWGGLVARVEPRADVACWGCIETAQAEGTVEQPPEAPDEEGRVQPQGCGDPTFTGAGFDMTTIANSAVRAAAALLGEGEDRYPDQDWNVEILSLRGGDGEAAPLQSQVYQIDRREDCPICAA